MATIKELSLKCGVSVSTVSKALNGYHDISETTRELVIKTANEMGYFPDANARALKLKKTYNLGVLYEDASSQGLRNEFFAHILAAFKEVASKEGYDITFIEHEFGKRKMSYLEHCRNRNFDGICIACADYEDAEVKELVNSSFPVVTIDRSFAKTVAVFSDNLGGMKDLVQYAIDQGHRRIAYISGSEAVVTDLRRKAFMETMSENGIPVRSEYSVSGVYRNPKESEMITYRLLELPEPPTCILASDDYSAFGIMNAVIRKGLKVPDDVSVAGFDGITVAQSLEPCLTTVRQDADQIGAEAAKQLINLIENPKNHQSEDICLRAQLVKGGTVRKLDMPSG